MRGGYYLKHTINHSYDNRHRIIDRNNSYKESVRLQAIGYLKKPDLSIEEKVKYLRNLQTNTYRLGTKYMYDCNFNIFEIRKLIKILNDDELHQAYFGKTIQEYDSKVFLTYSLIFGAVIILCFIVNSWS